MTDMNELLKQARQMQEQMQKAQQDAAARIVVGEAGAGMVRIHMTGRHDVTKVELSNDLMQEDREIVEDLIAAAINDAAKRIDDSSRDALSGLTAGMKLPEGFKFPF
jgi:DNA-binding YbaB/EbfC family protein